MDQFPTLDRIDTQIIQLLQNDGRLSNKELAAQVGLAPSSCWDRVKRLIDRGAILGFHAEVSPAAVGLTLQAMISVRLRQHSRRLVESFRDHANSLSEVMAVYHVAGAQDFLIHVGVRDAEHLRELTLASFTTRPEVDRIETSLVFEYQRPRHKPPAPDYLQSDCSA